MYIAVEKSGLKPDNPGVIVMADGYSRDARVEGCETGKRSLKVGRYRCSRSAGHCQGRQFGAGQFDGALGAGILTFDIRDGLGKNCEPSMSVALALQQKSVVDLDACDLGGQ